MKQDGQAVFRFAVRKTEEMCGRLLSRNNLTASDIDLFVSHQANRRIIQSAAERIGFPPEKVVINIANYGNTTAATIPLALDDAVKDGRLKKGRLVLVTSVGAGFRSTASVRNFCDSASSGDSIRPAQFRPNPPRVPRRHTVLQN